MFQNSNTWFGSLAFVDKSFWNFPKFWGLSRCFPDGQPSCLWRAVLLGMTILFFLIWTTLMDELELASFSIFSSPSIVPLSKGRPEHCRIYGYSLDVSLCQWLDVVPHVMTSLVTGRVDLPFRGISHVSFSSWLCHFKCQISLPINSGIPLLSFIFPKFSPLTFVVQCLI